MLKAPRPARTSALEDERMSALFSCASLHIGNRVGIFRILKMDGPLAATGARTASSFVTDKAYINGSWVSAKSGATFEVFNPSNGKVIGTVPDMDTPDVELAIQAAHNAFQNWKATSAKERSIILRRWYNLIMENQDELGKLLTMENGKPLAEGKGEVGYGASFVEWFAEEARRTYGDIVPSPAPSKRIVVIKQPVGVSAMITPWNFPNAMISRKAAPALAAGCTVVLRPAEDTPYSALALAELAEKAGVPPGVFNIVTSSRDNAGKIGKVLCENPIVAKISFTGSTPVGKILLAQAAGTVKRVSMELGGNAPFIVFDSADVDKAVQGCMVSKFRGSGQTCVCANRIFAQAGIHDRFVSALQKAVDGLKVGDGFEDGVTQGPLINQRGFQKVDELVKDAVSKGASVMTGGEPHECGGNFYKPTLITGVVPEMRCSREEIFGPVAAVMKFKTEEEAVILANSTSSGLAGYFFTENMSQAWRVAENLDYGMVGVNEGLMSMVEAPFGGVKESGLGREGSKYGIDEFLEVKYMCFGNI